MTTEITNQLAAAKLRCVHSLFQSSYTDSAISEAPSSTDPNWKDGLKIPSKDLRPQTEVLLPRVPPCNDLVLLTSRI